MSERVRPWWEVDVPRVIEEANVLYDRIVREKDPTKTKLAVTKRKIIEIREWKHSLPLIDKNFDRVLTQLGFFYVPPQVIPGPAFVFPIRGYDGKITMAQTKPMEGSKLVIPNVTAKYRFIGDKPVGPRWLGNDPITLKKIIDTRKVIVVEGPFDLLAARLVCPDLPIMSPLTKRLGKQHEAYLRILGVRNITLMFDNEEAKGNDADGAGNMSMEQQVAAIKTMKVSILNCPHSDPSACLKNRDYTQQLRSRLRDEF